jgi:hypothetical protein
VNVENWSLVDRDLAPIFFPALQELAWARIPVAVKRMRIERPRPQCGSYFNAKCAEVANSGMDRYSDYFLGDPWLPLKPFGVGLGQSIGVEIVDGNRPPAMDPTHGILRRRLFFPLRSGARAASELKGRSSHKRKSSD